MNSLEILQALRHLSVRYAGVYPADRLPRVWTRSIAIIANTDDHDRPGQHWVAFYIDKHETGTYFDSYGLPPLDSRFLLRLRRNSIMHRWNTTQLQGMLSQTCGQYCCVFLYFMCNGYNLNQFLNLFDNNYNRNDHLIVKLFRKIFLPSKNECVKSHAVCCHVQSCTFKSKIWKKHFIRKAYFYVTLFFINKHFLYLWFSSISYHPSSFPRHFKLSYCTFLLFKIKNLLYQILFLLSNNRYYE